MMRFVSKRQRTLFARFLSWGGREGWDTGEDQKRCQQEATANTEQPRQKTHGAAHAEYHEDIHRNLGYGQV